MEAKCVLISMVYITFALAEKNMTLLVHQGGMVEEDRSQHNTQHKHSPHKTKKESSLILSIHRFGSIPIPFEISSASALLTKEV